MGELTRPASSEGVSCRDASIRLLWSSASDVALLRRVRELARSKLALRS